MLRQYLEMNGNVLNLPYELSASPRNPLFKEVEASFNFVFERGRERERTRS
jgi:hypothetical protein